MANIVLVPGFWLGGWAWERVTPVLRELGHDVYPVTLTGLGDRAHLATPEVDLETHTTDIVNVLTYADLRDVVLVAHSGGGMPAAVAADRIPERIRRVVYVDSAALPNGMAQHDLNPPEMKEAIDKQVAEDGDGWRLPPPPIWDDPSLDPANMAGLGEAELAWMRSRAVPTPFGAATGKVQRTTAGRHPETLVSCTFPEEQANEMIKAGHPMFSGFGSDLSVVPLPTGHWPMFSRPEDTARTLDQIARRAATSR